MSTPGPLKFQVDRLGVEVHPGRQALGHAAATAVCGYLHEQLAQRGEARVMFACAPSQNEFLAELVRLSSLHRDTYVPWDRVVAFHMDDYVGLHGNHPQSFRRYLYDHLLRHVRIKEFHPLESERTDPVEAAREYSRRLDEGPMDLICLGIGENTHIAFNDPPVADFQDTVSVKPVELDEACRKQQVADGCFPDLAAVPRLALTVTIPVFRRARRLSIQVPGARKAAAIAAVLQEPVERLRPASILRSHSAATLYLDLDSASRLNAPGQHGRHL